MPEGVLLASDPDHDDVRCDFRGCQQGTCDVRQGTADADIQRIVRGALFRFGDNQPGSLRRGSCIRGRHPDGRSRHDRELSLQSHHFQHILRLLHRSRCLVAPGHRSVAAAQVRPNDSAQVDVLAEYLLRQGEDAVRISAQVIDHHYFGATVSLRSARLCLQRHAAEQQDR